MSSGVDTAIAILALASDQNPQWPAAYLLGLAVGALQEEGASLEEIQRWVEKAFDATPEEAAAAARLFESPRRAPS